MLMATELKPIAPYFKGQIVGYVEKAEEQKRALLSTRRFHIVQTHAQQENRVARDIEEELGMAAYVPRIPSSVRVNAGKHRKVMKPMYRGYMFVGFDPASEPWWKISDIKGVLRLFKIDMRPVSVLPSVMERIREREIEESFGIPKLAPIGIKVGTVIRIIECGAYTGMFVPVTQVNEAIGRICVALDLVGRPVPFWLSPEQIEVV